MTPEQYREHCRRTGQPCALDAPPARPEPEKAEPSTAAQAGEEIALQGEIAKYLRLHELEYIKPDHRKKSPLPPGWPDFTLCYRGTPLALEVKTETGKLDPDQVAMHARLRANGWRVQVVRSIADVQAIFRDIDRNQPVNSD